MKDRNPLLLNPDPMVRMADGTIKQRNPLTGTQVWTVTSRGKRPHSHRRVLLDRPRLLLPSEFTNACAFCADRYFDTLSLIHI